MSYATIDSTVLSSIQTAIQNGIVVISAGGNNYQNLSNNGLVSNPPQGTVVVAAPELIVVAASNILDNPWIVTPTPGTNNGTNYGSYIDIWSPGQDIWTAGIFNGSSFPPIKVSGSDFAAAHVSGVMALFLGGAGIGINSSYVQSAKNQLILNSTTDIIVFNTNISFAGTPNRLLFNSLDGNYSITDAVLNSSGSQYSEQPNSRFLRKSPGTTT